MSGTENTFDTNNNRTLVAVSNADGTTPVNVWADPSTHALLTSGGGGGGSGTQYAEGTTTAPATGTVALGRYNTSSPTLTNGQLNAPQLDVNGNLKVNIAAGSSSGQQYADGAVRGTATGTLGMVDDGTNIQSMAGDTDGNAKVVGSVAAGTTDSGNPVKVGGRYNSTLPTLTDGQRSDLQVDTRGGLQIVVTDRDGTGGAVVGSQATNLVTNTNGLQTRSTNYGQFDDVSPGALTEDRLGIVRMSANRNSYQTIRDAAGNERGANVTSGNALVVDGSATTQPVSIAGNVTTILANNGTTSTGNSTTSNLGIGAIFTGTGEDILNYSAVQISVFSSHASATDGLALQQSSDNTNWDFIDLYTVAAATGKVFSVQPTARYFRIVYTNGATLTTSLRIQTVYHVNAPNPSSQRSSDTYTNETDLTQQWAFNSLYNGTTWDRMRGDITNGLDVDVTRLPTLANVTTVATVSALGTGTTGPMKAEDVAHASGDMGIPAWGVINTNLGTTFAATGDYAPHSVDIKGRTLVAQKAATGTLTNVTASATTQTILAANAERIGATITNDSSALLYLKFGATASTTSYTVVLAGAASAPFSYYEVPAGYTGIIDGISASATGTVRVTEIS